MSKPLKVKIYARKNYQQFTKVFMIWIAVRHVQKYYYVECSLIFKCTMYVKDFNHVC